MFRLFPSIVSNDAMNMHVHVFVWTYVSILLDPLGVPQIQAIILQKNAEGS